MDMKMNMLHVRGHGQLECTLTWTRSIDVDMQNGPGHVEWILTCRMDPDMQHGTWICIGVMYMHHGYGHAPWTWTCGMDMDMDMKHRQWT
jgi:hypothetical protein